MLKIQNLSFSYSSLPFLENITLYIEPGENVGIIGPNGSGKSTLVKLIAGILEPSAGQIYINQQQLADLQRKSAARLMAYVPQTVEVSFNFLVNDVVAMGRFPHAETLLIKDKNYNNAVNSAIAKMNLEEMRYRPFSDLSGGEKQRTVIASALAQESNLLLLDEPTSALDLKHQQEIYNLLRHQCREEKKTVIVVTHDINLAAQFCDRLILLNHGKIIKDGSPGEVLKFQIIQDVYGVNVYIDINPFTKSIYILPYELR